MVCLFYISISIQGRLIAYKHQKALIVAHEAGGCSPSTRAYSCRSAAHAHHTGLLAPDHSCITSILTYLWAQSLHHVAEEVIQLFALNVAVICQDRACKFSVICPHRSIIVISQLNSSA